MQKLIYLIFAATFLCQWLANEISIIPSLFKYIVDLLAVFTSFLVFLGLAIRNRLDLPKRYILIITYFIFIIIVSAFLNSIPPKQIILFYHQYIIFQTIISKGN